MIQKQILQSTKVHLKPGNPNLERILLLRRALDASKLSEDNQQFIWRMRYKIHRLFPQMLVVLANCSVVWRERETICEFYRLLRDWPRLQAIFIK